MFLLGSGKSGSRKSDRPTSIMLAFFVENILEICYKFSRYFDTDIYVQTARKTEIFLANAIIL